MKLHILSDLHTEHHPFALADALEYDVAILAGDIDSPGSDVPRTLHRPKVIPSRPILWVPGNHEYYERCMQDESMGMRSAAQSRGIHFLDCDVVVIDGVRFLGCTLWTHFAPRVAMTGLLGCPMIQVSDRARGMRESELFVRDYTAIRIQRGAQWKLVGPARLRPLDTLKIHGRQRRWLHNELAKPFAGPTVVVTHHAPHRNSLAPKYASEWTSTAFVSELPAEFFAVPVLWIHGHTHTCFDYRVGNCRVICNPRGYKNWHDDFEGSAFNPRLVVEI